VDIVFNLAPEAFKALVPTTFGEREGPCEFWDAGGLPAEFGTDVVRVCTLNGAGWTVGQILQEGRQILGDPVFDLAGSERIFVCLEYCLGESGTKTFDEVKSAVKGVTGPALTQRSGDKVIDVTLGSNFRKMLGLFTGP
jgi:hypothetical protein